MVLGSVTYSGQSNTVQIKLLMKVGSVAVECFLNEKSEMICAFNDTCSIRKKFWR